MIPDLIATIPNNKMDYSIIIPAYNEEELLPETLRSVEEIQQKLSAKFAGELIVVDNNSSDRTADIVRASRAKLVFEKENCIARARNKGAESAQGRYLIFLDADTMAPLELIERALLCLSGAKVCGGGAFVGFEDDGVTLTEKVLSWIWNNVAIRIYPVAAGSFLFCLKDAWSDCGGFDERYYASEEIHFSKALKKWGAARALSFTIIPVHVKSSSRKFKVYSKLHIFSKILPLILFPWLLRRKTSCSIWYERIKEKKTQ